MRRLLARGYRAIWGDDVEPELRPLLGTAFAGTLSVSAAFPFLGIWAIEELGASQKQLGAAFLAGAIMAVVAGYTGGHLSDHIGRRPVLLAAWAGQALVPLALLAAGSRVLAGLLVMTLLGVFGSVFSAAQYALVADLSAPDRRENGYAAVRVAQNLGVCFGPPIGGLLLLGGSWTRLWIGVFALTATSLAIGYRFVPRGGLHAPEAPPERGSLGVVVRDHPFLLFVGVSVLASMTYLAFDALLPISLATSHGIAPSAWGFLVIINAGLVAFGQLRVTRAAARFSPAAKLAVAMPLMGFPFLFLAVADSVAVVALLMVVFVVGEMLWVPTSQAVVATFAPPDLRGAYMGLYGSASQAAWALTPFLGLLTREAFGDEVMWACVAVVSVLAAVGMAAAAHGRRDAPAVASAPA